jgi:hypothetical protein
MTVHRLAVATKRKSVPRNARYLLGAVQAHLLDLPLDPVTTISREPCQREIAPSVTSLRVTSFAPAPSRPS